jgi:hypothetical protein
MANASLRDAMKNLVLILLLLLTAGCSTSSAASPSSIVDAAVDAGPANGDLSVCPAQGVPQSEYVFPPSAIPEGVACTGAPASCYMLINPCGNGYTSGPDGWTCTCTSGKWSCFLNFEDASGDVGEAGSGCSDVSGYPDAF